MLLVEGARVEGAPLGVIMLETRFERIQGDIGNPLTFSFPVIFEVVLGASASRVVHDRAAGLVEAFIAAGQKLVERGAVGILTSCGFMALHQRALATALPVPVATSSLLQLPLVDRVLPQGRRAGVLTISAADLTTGQLAAVGAAADTPIGGLPSDGHFAAIFLGNRQGLDPELAKAELLAAADRLLGSHPEIGAIVLECTNMGPYSAALARHCGLPFFDVVSLANWLYQGVRPPIGDACP